MLAAGGASQRVVTSKKARCPPLARQRAAHAPCNMDLGTSVSQPLILTLLCNAIALLLAAVTAAAPVLQGYAAAKAGLLGLTHSQAASLADRQLRVNAVLPGWINTWPDEPITPQQHAWHWTGDEGLSFEAAGKWMSGMHTAASCHSRDCLHVHACSCMPNSVSWLW